jgi:antitoxin (DNA-binding transcriptional repressor) of toxin-antitoxin stability system
MKMVSVRDFRSRSARVWRELAKERNLVITSNGKPIGILLATTEETLEQSLSAARRTQALQALMDTQLEAVRDGRSRLTLKDINEEIAKVRRARHK